MSFLSNPLAYLIVAQIQRRLLIDFYKSVRAEKVKNVKARTSQHIMRLYLNSSSVKLDSRRPRIWRISAVDRVSDSETQNVKIISLE